MSEATLLLTTQFLEWVAAEPRSYADTMEAWRTSCPRLPVWEDAVDGGLVRLEPDQRHAGRCVVALTPAGRARLGARCAA